MIRRIPLALRIYETSRADRRRQTVAKRSGQNWDYVYVKSTVEESGEPADSKGLGDNQNFKSIDKGDDGAIINIH